MSHLRIARYLAACLAGLVFVAPASLLAQEGGPTDSASVSLPEDDEEEEKDEDEDEKDQEKEDEDEKPLETTFLLTSEGHTFNNLDLRELDETSDQDILESDDRGTFGYTSLAGELSYEVLETAEFNFAAAHTGLWGNDQIGGLIYGDTEGPSASNFLWVYRMNASWEPIDTESLGFELTVGRQDWELGGAEEDYFMDDTIDGVTAELELGAAGAFRALALDFYGANSTPKNVNFARYAANHDTIMPFRGDTNTLRHGLVYENTELIEGLELRGFGFYADVGASTEPESTGADRSYHGALGNVSDHDYTWMTGARAGYTFESELVDVGGFGEFAHSRGIDRKDTQIGLEDVYTVGNAYGAGVHSTFKPGGMRIKAKARWFHADGGEYSDNNGMQYNHGFVGFKGDEVGGLNLDRYAGFHPSAYLGNQGVVDSPHAIERSSGTEFIQGGLTVDIAKKFRTAFDVWYLWDTSNSGLDQDKIGQVASDLPFGYTEADLEAQERFGKPIGTELNLSMLYRANEVFNIYSRGGIFLPSDYYEIEISRTVAGNDGVTAKGSENPVPFWAVAAGTTLKF